MHNPIQFALCLHLYCEAIIAVYEKQTWLQNMPSFILTSLFPHNLMHCAVCMHWWPHWVASLTLWPHFFGGHQSAAEKVDLTDDNPAQHSALHQTAAFVQCTVSMHWTVTLHCTASMHLNRLQYTDHNLAQYSAPCKTWECSCNALQCNNPLSWWYSCIAVYHPKSTLIQ